MVSFTAGSRRLSAGDRHDFPLMVVHVCQMRGTGDELFDLDEPGTVLVDLDAAKGLYACVYYRSGNIDNPCI